MKLPLYDAAANQIGGVEVDELVFGISPHTAVLRQALLAQLANRRAGSANTKTRGEVRGSTAKGQLIRGTLYELRPQKGMGRARQGGLRAPHHRHGGVAHGPKPRSYKQALPKLVRRLAIRSAISARVAAGELRVVDDFGIGAPRTKPVAELLGKFGLARAVLMVTGGPDRNLLLGARNLQDVKVLPADTVNVVDLMAARGVLMTVASVRRAEALWGGQRVKNRRATVPSTGLGTDY
jgi:large subunit ribosomal protein L4